MSQNLNIDNIVLLINDFFKNGHFAEALAFISTLSPRLREEPHVLYLEAIAAYRVGDVSKAVSLQKKAITANSRGIGYHANLCLYARTLGDIELAVDSGRRACNMFPNDPAALNNYANALKDAKRFDIALTQYEKTYKLRPFYLNPIKQGLTIARALFNQTAALNWETRLSDALRAPESTLIANNTPADFVNAAYLNVVCEIPEGGFDRLVGLVARMFQRNPNNPRTPRPISPTGGLRRKLKVAYMSANFGDHPIGHVTSDLFRAHDRERLELYGIFLARRDKESAFFFKNIVNSFDFCVYPFDTQGGSSIQSVKDLHLDVLVYLDGFMSPGGIELLSHRIARKQIFWLGHAGTLPLPFIDGTIIDCNVAPPDFLARSDASALFLPPPYHCYTQRPARIPGDERSLQRRRANFPEDAFVFCGFNNPEKLTPEALDAWCRILNRVPRSILWLSNLFEQKQLTENIHRFAYARGLSPNRIAFHSRDPDKRQHLSRHCAADLFLDTFSLNASTTALDALSMGLPVLTLAGSRFSNRIAGSFLEALGLNELIAANVDAYVEKAVELASRPEALKRLRSHLENDDLFDDRFSPHQFAPKLERLFFGIT